MVLHYTILFAKMFFFFWLFQVLIVVHKLPLVVASGGYFLFGVHGLLVAVGSLVVEHRF